MGRRVDQLVHHTNPRLDHIDATAGDGAPVAPPFVRCAEKPAPLPLAPGTKLRLLPVEPTSHCGSSGATSASACTRTRRASRP